MASCTLRCRIAFQDAPISEADLDALHASGVTVIRVSFTAKPDAATFSD